MSSRKTHAGADKVYAAAQKWVDCALRSDDSLFTPGTPIWSSQWLRELRECYLNNPDTSNRNFYEKLKDQLTGKSREVYQLMGEVLYVHFLIIWHEGMKSVTKVGHINKTFEWSKQEIAIPDDLVDGLTSGIARIGAAYSRLLPFMVGFIIEFVDQWKELEPNERRRLLDEPYNFKDFATRLDIRGDLFREGPRSHRPQWEALFHLVFPDTFEGTVSGEHKRLIAEAKAFAHFLTEPTNDVDRKIMHIRQGLEAGLGRDFDFYDRDVRSRWDPSASDAWDTYLRYASDYLNTGKMQSWELNYKFDVGRKLSAGREAVLTDTGDWAIQVKRGFAGNLVFSVQQARFREWINMFPDDARRSLQAIWTRENSSVSERIRAFGKQLPESAAKGTGTRMNVISVLLMGLDVEKYPPFRVGVFNNAYERTGYDKPPQGADEAALYEHALGFLDRFIEEARKRGMPVRHRLDAQSLVWIIPYQESEKVEAELQPSPEPPSLEALANDLHLSTNFLQNIESLLSDKKQIIFQGPPGTGKTYVAQKFANHLAGSDDRVTLVQFHPSYAYEDFVQGFRPATLKNGQPGFKMTDGPLLRAAERARQEPDENHFLIIDEINRGQIAKVFGELYFLLEYRDEAITLQYQQEERFSLPENLYIIGTMNTADRSIALVDLALRRRFYFVDFHPDDEPIKGVLRRWAGEKASGMEWVADIVERANELLQEDRDAAIGPSYFMKDGLDDETVERIWAHSVRPYVAELLHGQPDRLDDFNLDRLRVSGSGDGGGSDGQESINGEAGDGDRSDAGLD